MTDQATYCPFCGCHHGGYSSQSHCSSCGKPIDGSPVMDLTNVDAPAWLGGMKMLLLSNSHYLAREFGPAILDKISDEKLREIAEELATKMLGALSAAYLLDHLGDRVTKQLDKAVDAQAERIEGLVKEHVQESVLKKLSNEKALEKVVDQRIAAFVEQNPQLLQDMVLKAFKADA